ncbi:MAG: phosphatidylcholine synthase [Xanthobacteraceae bacterium]
MPATPARRIASFSVHLLTAAGAAIAFFALTAAIAGEFTVTFVLLGLALLIDGIDGTLARRLKVAEVLPRWSGDVLDLVVDFLNYVFVPTFALVTGAILAPPFALPAAVAILISSAIYFADTNMKTEDGYFRGFPALWNIVVFYLFVLHPDPTVALVLVALFIVLTFAPILFAHPLRAKRWAVINLILLAAWGALGLAALWYHLSPPPAVVLGLVVLAVYFIAVGLARPAHRKP